MADAEASLACTATQLLASCTDIPASTGAVQPLNAFGMLSYCSNQAEHMLAIIQLLLQADGPEAKSLWAPLVAAAGDASQLPPELQPYHPHMTAALANWYDVRTPLPDDASVALQCLRLERVFRMCSQSLAGRRATDSVIQARWCHGANGYVYCFLQACHV